MLTTYPEIRDRIYELARQHDLRPDWVEITRDMRHLLLYDTNQIIVARARVPLRRMDAALLTRLAHDLVSKLKQAGVSVRDSAAMLGLSPSRVDQLRRSA